MRGPNVVRTKRARLLRRSDNDAEQMMWSELRNRRLNGYKFVRQLAIGPYFADFACREASLVLEIDGSQHAASQRDRIRDDFLISQGWSVLRVWNVDALRERGSVLDTLLAALEGRLDRHVEAADLRFVAAAGYGEVLR